MRFYTVEQISNRQSRTPEGYLVCERVPIARTGTMIYGPDETPIKTGPDGHVRVERDEAEVFRPETIMSFQGKPICIEHPEEDVTVKNWGELAVGVVLNPRRGHGVEDDLLLADLLVTKPEAIDDIEKRRRREISCGYDSDYIEFSPGHGKQANIVGNHVALVETGRCGPRCAVGDKQVQQPPPFRTRRPRKMATRDAVLQMLRTAFKAKDEKELEPLAAQLEDVGDGSGTHVHIHTEDRRGVESRGRDTADTDDRRGRDTDDRRYRDTEDRRGRDRDDRGRDTRDRRGNYRDVEDRRGRGDARYSRDVGDRGYGRDRGRRTADDIEEEIDALEEKLEDLHEELEDKGTEDRSYDRGRRDSRGRDRGRRGRDTEDRGRGRHDRDEEGPAERQAGKETRPGRKEDEEYTQEERRERGENVEDRRGGRDEKILGDLEMEAPPGTGDKARKARDSEFLHDSFQETVQLAEIIAPGIQVPTYDRAARPIKTLDTICRMRKDALDLNYSRGDDRALITQAMRGAPYDSRRMTCDQVREVFRSVGLAKASQNNALQFTRTPIAGAGSGAGAPASGAVKTLSDLNKQNAAFYKDHPTG